jgi:GH43 family beta-xylosidase
MKVSSLTLLAFVAFTLLDCGQRPQAQSDAPDTVGQVFTNPLLPSGADPWVVAHNGTYYVTHSTGKDLKLYRTSDVSQLSKAQSKIVWTPPATGCNDFRSPRMQKFAWRDDGTPDFGTPVKINEPIPVPSGSR